MCPGTQVFWELALNVPQNYRKYKSFKHIIVCREPQYFYKTLKYAMKEKREGTTVIKYLHNFLKTKLYNVYEPIVVYFNHV